MNKTKKIALAAATLITAALAFTSCSSLGKDDFYGTWHTNYTVTQGNFLAAGAPGADNSPRPNDAIGSNVDMTIYFDGKTETIFNSSGSRFYQYRVRKYNGEVKSTTLWVGKYELSENQNYTSGTLTLTYLYGWSGISSANADEYARLWLSDDCKTDAQAADLFGDGKPKDATYDYTSSQNTDVEKFTFTLGGQDLFKGYSTMTTTAKENCSWEVKSRSFELQSTDFGFLQSLGGTDDRAVLPRSNESFTAEEYIEK